MSKMNKNPKFYKINKNIKTSLNGLQKMEVFIKIYNFHQHLVKLGI